MATHGERSVQPIESGDMQDSPKEPLWAMRGTRRIAWPAIALVLLACMLPNIALVIFLSDMGVGMQVYDSTAPTSVSRAGDAILVIGSLCIAFLYVFDWLRWNAFRIQCLAAAVPVSIIIAGTILKSRKYPWAPLLFTVFLEPFFLGVIRHAICRTTLRTDFHKWVCIATGISAFALVFAWIIWVEDGHRYWEVSTKEDLAGRCRQVYEYMLPSANNFSYMGYCHPDHKNLTGLSTQVVKDVTAACASAENVWFLVWMAPVIAAVCNFVAALFSLINAFAFLWEPDKQSTSVLRALRQFMIFLVFIFTCMYCAISFTSLTLGSTLMAFFAAALTILIVWTMLEIGPSTLDAMAKSNPRAQSLLAMFRSDWLRAIAVGAVNILIPIFFLFSWMNQRVRIWFGKEKDRTKKYPDHAQKLLDAVQDWNWVSILVKVAILAEVFFTLQIGVSKVTYIFLSWLSKQLMSVNFGLVCALVFAIGFIMFMLPPVPGIPVYVFTGIVIADQGDRRLGPNGFIWGILIAVALAFVNKLCACCGQYAVGYFLGTKVKIQQLIKVDSVPTRAIESIVKRKGLNPAKIAILIGGPDWPTSVGCGIVKVSVPQMIVGTLPVIFLMSPCVLAGAFIARQGASDSIFPMLANISLVTATISQALSMLVAGAYIFKEIQDNGEELKKYRPEHRAVAELTKAEAKSNEVYRELTAWDVISSVDKLILICAAGSLELSCFMFVMLASACFRPFSVDKDINAPWEEGGLNGDPFSIVLAPLGHVSLIIFFLGVVLHIVHNYRIKAKHKGAMQDVGPEPPANTPPATVVGRP